MTDTDYEIHEFIGRGSFGEVFKGCKKGTNELYAFKVIPMDDTDNLDVIIKEIQFLSRLRSPYINRHHETFLKNTDIWIVLEYCGGGSCADLLRYYGSLDEQVTAYIIRSVLKGLRYLHEERKVHRDIKLGNILITDDGKVKLGDFGVSGELTFTKTRRNSIVGTPYWMAPEVIQRSVLGYNAKADIWSTGITTIELLCGNPPHYQKAPMKALFEIPRLKAPSLDDQPFNADTKDFVKHCLLKYPDYRPSAARLLHHRFITTCPTEVPLVALIEQRKLHMRCVARKRPFPRKALQMPPLIHWNLTSESSESESNEAWRNKYSEMIYDSITRVWARAINDTAKEGVLRLRDEFVRAESDNCGLSYAIVEELWHAMTKRDL